MLILGTWGAASVLFYPLYLETLGGEANLAHYIKAGLVSVQHSIRLFAFDGDYKDIVDMLEEIALNVELPKDIPAMYTFLGAALYLVAPILTVGLILSFFKNMTSYIRYVFSFWKSTHVFSELNEKSLALAKSIDDANNKKGEASKRRYKLWRKALIVFTDIIEKDDEATLELLEEAKEIGAILFTKDLESIKYRNRRFAIRKVNFYLISDDEQEKIRHAESIINDYRDIKNTKLFLFSNYIESKCFLDSYTKDDKKGMRLKVIRINDIRALIYHTLNENGIRLFENANKLPNGIREVSVAIVGMGQYGMEMLKALIWYCQLPGYRVKINVFDERKDAEAIFNAACPEINTKEPIDAATDARYTVKIQTAKYGTKDFYDAIKEVEDISYLFVCLGSDRDNISASSGIRNWLIQDHKYPDIETVIYDSSLKKRIAAEFAKQEINIIGDLDSFYSEGVVINSEFANRGLEVHRRWDTGAEAENNFYMNDYNYYSSLASALHRNLREQITAHEQTAEVFPFYDQLDDVSKRVFQDINSNDKLKSLSEEMEAFATYLYIRLAYLHYQKMTVQERKRVLDKLQSAMTKKNISATIPMLNDTVNYIDGYEASIQTFEDRDEAEQEKSNDEKNRKKHQKEAMRLIFDAIVTVKTEGIQDESKKRDIIRSLEFQALSDAEQASVREYVRCQLGKTDDQSFTFDDYFKKGNQFAGIEHIRWNAYMRTEGFRRAIETRKEHKLHYDLVPIELLTFADCIKDI